MFGLCVSLPSEIKYHRLIDYFARTELYTSRDFIYSREWRTAHYSFLRTLITWHCPHSPAPTAAMNQYLLPARPTAANLQQRICCCGPRRDMDRRTDTVPFHRPCSAQYAGSANNDFCTFLNLSADIILSETRHIFISRAVRQLPAISQRWFLLSTEYCGSQNPSLIDGHQENGFCWTQSAFRKHRQSAPFLSYHFVQWTHRIGYKNSVCLSVWHTLYRVETTRRLNHRTTQNASRKSGMICQTMLSPTTLSDPRESFQLRCHCINSELRYQSSRTWVKSLKLVRNRHRQTTTRRWKICRNIVNYFSCSSNCNFGPDRAVSLAI